MWVALQLQFGWSPTPRGANSQSHTQRKRMPGRPLLISPSAAAAADSDANYNTSDKNGKQNGAVVSGITARGRRLLKIREGKRKREYDRLHNYPSWAKSYTLSSLSSASAFYLFHCFNDHKMKLFISFPFSDSECLKTLARTMRSFELFLEIALATPNSCGKDFNPVDSYIWFELYGSPTEWDVHLIGSVIQSWYVMGRLDAFNSSILQLANQSMDHDPLYDAEKGFKVMPSSFHDISYIEFQDSWGHFWVDLGTSDFFAIDVLLNCLTVLSSEYLGIQQVVFGGHRIGDWEEAMTNSEFGKVQVMHESLKRVLKLCRVEKYWIQGVSTTIYCCCIWQLGDVGQIRVGLFWVQIINLRSSYNF